MKQDIRDLFKEDDVSGKQLPVSHRAEFLNRLKNQSKTKQKSRMWLNIAAVFLIALTIGFSYLNTETQEEQKEPILAEIKTIEAKYLADIETEWQSFIAIAEDEVLIERFRNKLKELDTKYKEITVQFKTDANNILVIEALVDNLQTRLQILKDIQRHIKILNQKNESHGNTI